MVLFYEMWKKYNEIQLIRNKMDLNNRIMRNDSNSPEYGQRVDSFYGMAMEMRNSCKSVLPNTQAWEEQE